MTGQRDDVDDSIFFLSVCTFFTFLLRVSTKSDSSTELGVSLLS